MYVVFQHAHAHRRIIIEASIIILFLLVTTHSPCLHQQPFQSYYGARKDKQPNKLLTQCAPFNNPQRCGWLLAQPSDKIIENHIKAHPKKAHQGFSYDFNVDFNMILNVGFIVFKCQDVCGFSCRDLFDF